MALPRILHQVGIYSYNCVAIKPINDTKAQTHTAKNAIPRLLTCQSRNAIMLTITMDNEAVNDKGQKPNPPIYMHRNNADIPYSI